MREASDRKEAAVDFAAEPVYQKALRLAGSVLDLEPKFPDDEREAIWTPMRRSVIEVGSNLASGFGLGLPGAEEPWRRARACLMEARHHVLLARSRYLIDGADEEAFETIYAEILGGIDALLARGGGGR